MTKCLKVSSLKKNVFDFLITHTHTHKGPQKGPGIPKASTGKPTPPPQEPVNKKEVQELLGLMATGNMNEVTEYLNSLGKKERDETKKQLSELLGKL